jgi:GxxExxY protein
MAFRHADAPDHTIPAQTEALARRVLDAAFEVHSELGPGLRESLYHEALVIVLRSDCIPVSTKVRVPVAFRGIRLSKPLEIDLLVGDQIVVEVKATEAIHPAHVAQVLTYLHLARKPLGFVLNFHAPHLRHGIRRLIRRTRPPPSRGSQPSA